MADRDAVSDALVNLLNNACKYSDDDGEVAVRVRADSRYLRIAVEDEGVGIPRGEQKRIFQKFYRVDERLSRAVEGSGLGLAIVMHIVAGHDGKITVDSAPGQGSTFTLLLPHEGLAEQAADSGRDSSTAPHEPSEATT